jgi:SAM-dependent methyltransferase
MRYTFGNTDIAAKRLEDVAAFFNPLSAEFIKKHVKGPVASALDLGCGPGFSTDMISRALGCRQTYGMDRSPEFLKTAGDRYPRYSFIEHDLTETPFPVNPDLMYARFVLTHLKDAAGLVSLWIGELSQGGVLLIEEVERIDTEVAAFKKYLEIIGALLQSQGADLFVGKTLAAGSYSADVLYNGSAIIEVANNRAAGWFYMNTLTVWDRERFIKDNFAPAETREVSDELGRIMESGDTEKGIKWKLRRLALKRK